jgi:TonB family protein
LGESFLRTTGMPATESLLNELDRCAQDPVTPTQAPITQPDRSALQPQVTVRQSQDSPTHSPTTQPTLQSAGQSGKKFVSQAHGASSDEVPLGVLEVPIGVWGSRRGAFSSGQQGRIEVFAEETSTVIVFPHGAVIRLSAAVAPGQMMMVTNRNSNQVAACRVVKARNYPNAKGYAEVEFFRPTIDFWGGYVPQGTMKLTESPAPEKLSEDFWSNGYTPEMINLLANARAAARVVPTSVRNKVAPIGKPGQRPGMVTSVPALQNPLPSLAAATSRKLAVASAQEHRREDAASERSWIRDFLSSLPGQVVALSGADRNFSPKHRMAFAWVTVTCLLVMGATGMFLLRRGAVQSGATAQINPAPEASAVSSAANATGSGQTENNSGSATSGVPIIAKTENFPGSPGREFGYNARNSQPSKRTSSLERKILNDGKPLPAPAAARRSTTVIGRELPPNVAAENSNAGAGVNPVLFAALMTPGGRVREPKLIVQSAPDYPAMAKRAQVEGEVTVSAVIDINGKLTNMKAVSGPTMLQQAALDSLRTWKYEPAFLNDKPVPVQTSITVKFRLR